MIRQILTFLNYRFIITFLIAIGFYSKVSSQSLTSNPYSYFGLGILDNNGFCESTAAGGAGIAMPSKQYLNQTNPASYCALDSAAFYFYLGMYGNFEKFTFGNLNQKDFESNLRYLAIGFKISKRWGSSVGLVPFSSRGYYIISNSAVEGELSNFTLISRGSGNINRFYFSNSYQLTHNFSLGANISYLFGMLKNDEQISNYNTYFNGVDNASTNYFNNIVFDFGLQYKVKFNKNSIFMGLTYSPLQNINTSVDRLIMNNTDTILSVNAGSEAFTLPQSIGLGLGIDLDNRLKLMLDYKLNKWSKSNYQYDLAKLTDSWLINTGAEFTNNKKSGRSYWDYVTFRMGFRYEKSYLKINDNQLNDIAFTTGISFPIKYNRSVLNFSYEYGVMGNNSNNTISERYNRFVLGLSLNDRWFQKTKFY